MYGIIQSFLGSINIELENNQMFLVVFLIQSTFVFLNLDKEVNKLLIKNRTLISRIDLLDIL